jgi:hypothetical protein
MISIIRGILCGLIGFLLCYWVSPSSDMVTIVSMVLMVVASVNLTYSILETTSGVKKNA